MKHLYLIFAAVVIASCAPKAFPLGSPDPRNAPGTPEPTAAELYAKNISAITSNPARARDF